MVYFLINMFDKLYFSALEEYITMKKSKKKDTVYRFDFDRSKLFDFYRVVTWGYNHDIMDMYNDEKYGWGISPDPEVIDAYSSIWSGVDKKTSGMEAFLSDNKNKISFIVWRFEQYYMNIVSFDDFINMLNSIPQEVLIRDLLYFVDEGQKDMEFYEDLKNNDDNLFNYIKELNIEPSLKWDITNFVYNTQNVIQGLSEVFKRINDRLMMVYDINMKKLKNFENDIRIKLYKQGNKFFLLEENPGEDEIININDFECVTISPSFMAELVVYIGTATEGKELYIYLGFNYLKSIIKRNATEYWREASDFMRAINDDTRQKIYGMVFDNEKYTAEIAAGVNVAPSTMAYHMKLFETANLLDKRYFSKWIYYSVNRENVERQINNLRKCILGIINENADEANS